MRYDKNENMMRQEALYSFLLSRGEKWTHTRQVTDSVNLYPTYNPKHNYHDTGTRRLLTKDITEINNSSKYEKIIISGDRGIKLANEKEFENFLRHETKEALKKLNYCRRIARKGSADQQIDLEGRITETFLRDVDA